MLSTNQMIIGAIVVLVVVIIIAYFMLKPKNDATKKKCAQQTVLKLGQSYLVLEDGKPGALTSDISLATPVSIVKADSTDPNVAMNLGFYVKSLDGRFITIKAASATSNLQDPGTNIITYDTTFKKEIGDRASLWISTYQGVTDLIAMLFGDMNIDKNYYFLDASSSGLFVNNTPNKTTQVFQTVNSVPTSC